MRTRLIILVAASAAVLPLRSIRSQAPTARAAGEVRVDAIIARATAVQLGGGVFYAVSENIWLGADLAGGLAAGNHRGSRLSGRADILGRIHFDTGPSPHWAPYLVAGLSQRVDARDRAMPYAVAGVGVEAPTTRHIVPALELSLGGGVRVGIVFRPGLPRGRGA